MNEHTFAALLIVIGLILALSCVVQAEICYCRARRCFAHNHDARGRSAAWYSSPERKG